MLLKYLADTQGSVPIICGVAKTTNPAQLFEFVHMTVMKKFGDIMGKLRALGLCLEEELDTFLAISALEMIGSELNKGEIEDKKP